MFCFCFYQNDVLGMLLLWLGVDAYVHMDCFMSNVMAEYCTTFYCYDAQICVEIYLQKRDKIDEVWNLGEGLWFDGWYLIVFCTYANVCRYL